MPSLRYFDGIQYGTLKGLTVLVEQSTNALYVTQPTLVKMLGWDSLDSTGVRAKFTSKEFKQFVGGCNFQGSESLNPLAGKALAGVKQYKGIDVTGRENKVNAIPFHVALAMVHWVAFEGKGEPQSKARALLMAGFADSFSSIVLEQCGVKVSTEVRQRTIGFYLDGYHEFQDWVRDTHARTYGHKPDESYYREMAVTINQFLFNRDHFYRDRLTHCGTPELRRLENFQIGFMNTKMAKRPTGDPLEMVKDYIDRLSC